MDPRGRFNHFLLSLANPEDELEEAPDKVPAEDKQILEEAPDKVPAEDKQIVPISKDIDGIVQRLLVPKQDIVIKSLVQGVSLKDLPDYYMYKDSYSKDWSTFEHVLNDKQRAILGSIPRDKIVAFVEELKETYVRPPKLTLQGPTSLTYRDM